MTDPLSSFPPATAPTVLPPEYGPFREEIKERIRSVQPRAAVSVNRERVLLCRQIGQRIPEAQQAEGRGTQVGRRPGAVWRFAEE